MPRHPAPLPEEWNGTVFSVHAARARGISRDRLSGPDLFTPFYGIRAPAGATDPESLAAAFGIRCGPDQAISHTTALLLWGAPLPRRIEQEQRIHVSSVGPSRPRTSHTVPHRLEPERTPTRRLGKLLLTAPATSWVLSAPLLGLDDLVAAGDFLVTGTEPFDGARPLTTLDALTRAVAARAGDRGIRRAREALALVRYGALSRRETFGRLMVVRAGLPEPALNYRVSDADGRVVAMVDMAHVEFRSAIEYESLLHLEPAKFRRDIRKQQELAAIDWATHRLTSDDVDPHLRTPASRAAAARIRATLLARGWLPPREGSHLRGNGQE